ncbi:hypothetical protein SAMN05428988_3224 [Chitinophaga sp. YR573]|uniref:hypothetical protein n=1 Tax=Chitinophaga sp. YR573 TaxID=1881040 RepID=UPI0008B551C4|nr:hypothetical protein [Chitinophaga sp. YR573]SEW21560.1 hypothetical protein SAMN05428988_3224 [Chitinophaga sp. YR573]
MRPRIDYRSTSKAAYNDFCSQHPNEQISFIQYKEIILGFNTLLADHVLETGERIKLPFGLGEISIAKFRPPRQKTFLNKTGKAVTITGLPINWQKTREHKKIIYHLNAHTDGNKYRWKWFVKNARFAGAGCFSFRANRIPSRKLAQYLKSDPKYAQIYRQWQD